jgi:curved DNA-binding protein CbpA
VTTSSAEKTYYDVLGVPPEADYHQLRKAFMRLSAEYARDRKNFPAAGWYADRAKEAYRILSDHESRRRYNAEIGLPDPAPPLEREEDEWWANVVPDNWYVYAFAFVGFVTLVMWLIARY